MTFAVGGLGGVPATGSPAVALTVAAGASTATGTLTVFTAGTARPATTNVSFVAGQSTSNLVVVKTAAVGTVSVYNGSTGTVQLSADVTGYYLTGTSSAAGVFNAVPPLRILPATTTVPAHASIDVQITGTAGIPTSNVAVGLLDLTVVSPTSTGSITAYPTGSTRPATLSVSFAAGASATNLGAVRVNASTGKVTVYNNSGAVVKVAVDALGYFLAGTPSVAGMFTKTAPAVLLDTTTGSPLAAGATRDVQVTGVAGVPSSGVAAVVLNVSALQSTSGGSLTVYPTGATRPPTRTTAFAAGRTTANLTVATLGANGRISIYNSAAGTVQVRAEVVGWISGSPTSSGLVWGTATLAHPPGGTLSGVSCAAVNFCAAVDAYGWAVQYNGSTRTAPRRIATDPLVGISCAKGTTFCLALDSAGNAFRLNGSTWTAGTHLIDGAQLTGVSCSSATWCVAVDSHGRAASFNGTIWTSFVTVDSYQNITGVSCVSSSSCVVVDGTGRWLKFTGTGWTAPAVLFSTGAPTTISCSSTTFCLAMAADGGTRTYNGSTWTTRTALSGASAMASVSCVSAGFCVATDDGQATYRWNGTSWSDSQYFAFFFDAPAYVSCLTTTFCMGAASTVGSVYNGGAWGDATVIDEEHARVVGVSCTSAAFCVSADSRSMSRFNGTVWTTPEIIGHLDTPSGDTDYAGSVSCATTTFCEVGSFSGDPGAGVVSGVRWNGRTWTSESAGLIGGSYAAQMSCPAAGFCVVAAGTRYWAYSSGAWNFPDDEITDTIIDALSCVSTTFCVATDHAGRWLRFNGTSWTAPASIGITPTAVDCPLTTFCVAVDGSGRRSTFNGSTWSAAAVIDAGGALSSVSCASSSFCVAVDGAGRTVRFDGAFWTAPLVIASGRQLVSVSCPTAQFCLAIDRDGYAVIGKA